MPITALELINGLIISMMGLNTPCNGSKRPQSALLAFALEASVVDVVVLFFDASASPFLRRPFALPLEPTVPARGRDVRPAFRALIRSLA